MRRVTDDEDGFSLVETLVALGIAAVTLLALLGTGVFALRSSVEARQNQQAGDLLNAAIEELRSLEYGSVSMTASDVAATTDAAVDSSAAPVYTFDHDADPSTAPERLWTRPTATPVLVPYAQERVVPSGRYTVRRYVTVPPTCTTPPGAGLCATYNADGSQPSVRRVTVVVSWQRYGKQHVRRAGTLLTNTRRGLPLPQYTWTYNGPAPLVGSVPTWTKNPGNQVDYGFVLVNTGATDAWKLTTNPTSPTWTFHHDVNQNGLYDAGEPPLGTTEFFTAQIHAGSAPYYVVATRTIDLAELGTSTTTFTATSVAQPTVPGKSVTTSLTVQSSAISLPSTSPSPTASASAAPVTCNPGETVTLAMEGVRPLAETQNQYALTDLMLLNGPPEGDTPTRTTNSLVHAATAVLQSQPCNFSTDRTPAGAGRLLSASGTSVETTARWLFQPGSAAQDEFRGTAVLSVWVRCLGTAPTFTARIGVLNTSTDLFEEKGSATTTSSTCTTAPSQYHRVDISVPLTAGSGNGFTVTPGSTQRLAVRVTTTQPVRMLYGTTPTPARLTIGLK